MSKLGKPIFRAIQISELYNISNLVTAFHLKMLKNYVTKILLTIIQRASILQRYRNKEKSFAALLGPVQSIIHPHYHCSTLMTHPKDIGSRRVILDLSYPRVHSVNSHVNGNKFEDSAFVLKFPNIDHIAEDIIRCMDDCVLFKVDVSSEWILC